MSGSVNKVTLLGRLGRDPEGSDMRNGGRVVSLSVATSESWKDRKTNERRERTEWHRVVIYNEPLGKIAEAYLRKGSAVYLEGELNTRKWSDKQGNDRYTTEVVLRPFRGELKLIGGKMEEGEQYQENESLGRDAQNSTSTAQVSTQTQQSAHQPQTTSDFDDDIPF